ncbi:MAG: DUF3311 domain-containing protein [bacterium]
MKKAFPKWSLFLALFVLYLLHNDLWFWHNADLVFGIPIGLFYHIVYCAAASLMMILLVKYAWPHPSQTKDKKEILR